MNTTNTNICAMNTKLTETKACEEECKSQYITPHGNIQRDGDVHLSLIMPKVCPLSSVLVSLCGLKKLMPPSSVDRPSRPRGRRCPSGSVKKCSGSDVMSSVRSEVRWETKMSIEVSLRLRSDLKRPRSSCHENLLPPNISISDTFFS